MSLLNTYTDEEKAALKEYRLPHEWHSMSSDHFVLGYRCNKALTEHLRLKEEENKQLHQDKAELVEALAGINKYMIEMLNSVPVRVAMQKRWINIEHANIALRGGINAMEKHKCD